MSEFNNEGRITLIRNEYHEEGDTKPDLVGFLTLHGVEYRVSLWRGEETGKAVLKGKVQEKDNTYSKPPAVDKAKPKPTPKPTVSPKPAAKVFGRTESAEMDYIPF